MKSTFLVWFFLRFDICSTNSKKKFAANDSLVEDDLHNRSTVKKTSDKGLDWMNSDVTLLPELRC